MQLLVPRAIVCQYQHEHNIHYPKVRLKYGARAVKLFDGFVVDRLRLPTTDSRVFVFLLRVLDGA